MERAINGSPEGMASSNFAQVPTAVAVECATKRVRFKVLEQFKEVLAQGGSFRVGLPRHFFQRTHTTTIKVVATIPCIYAC